MVANGGYPAPIEASIEDLVHQRRSRECGGSSELGGACSIELGLEAVKACLLEGRDAVHGTGNEWHERMDSIKMRRYESNSLIGPFSYPCFVPLVGRAP